jgi:oleandomycin transport system ATP-binding protein
VPVVVRRLDEAGIAIRDVSGRGSTLDDVFFALTGHGAEDDAADGETGGDRAAPATGNGDRGAEPVAAQEAVR